jgi:predicted ArsR family transcriptional regulator
MVTDVTAMRRSPGTGCLPMRSHPQDSPTTAQSALASPPRRRLLQLLRSAGGPQDAHELATAIGLHVSTVRFHLDVLGQAGLVVGRSQPRATAGRPRIVYSPLTSAVPDSSRTLLRLLATHLGNTPRARANRAERAGMAWAAELDAGLDLAGDVGEREAAQVVTGLFAELGFDPELTVNEPGEQVRLRGCPFREAARANPEVVCSVHLGLMRGILSRLGVPSVTARLTPFVEPEVCLAHLGQVPAG